MVKNNDNFLNQKIDMENKTFAPCCGAIVEVRKKHDNLMINQIFCVVCKRAFQKYTIKKHCAFSQEDEIKLKSIFDE